MGDQEGVATKLAARPPIAPRGPYGHRCGASSFPCGHSARNHRRGGGAQPLGLQGEEGGRWARPPPPPSYRRASNDRIASTSWVQELLELVHPSRKGSRSPKQQLVLKSQWVVLLVSEMESDVALYMRPLGRPSKSAPEQGKQEAKQETK